MAAPTDARQEVTARQDAEGRFRLDDGAGWVATDAPADLAEWQ